MRNCFMGSIAALATVLVFPAVPFAQAVQQPGTTKAGAQAKAFDAHDFAGVWNPAPRMQPKGEVNPLDLGGHPNPLPPFAPAGQLKYEANKNFIDAGAVLDCDPYGTARNFFTPRPFEIHSSSIHAATTASRFSPGKVPAE